jgi:hypothetical protein
MAVVEGAGPLCARGRLDATIFASACKADIASPSPMMEDCKENLFRALEVAISIDFRFEIDIRTAI